MRPIARDVKAIFARELLEILRDQRAVLAGIVLPIVLYPLLIFGMQIVQQEARERLAAEPFVCAVVSDESLFQDVTDKLGAGKVRKLPSPFKALRRGEVQVVVNDRDPLHLKVYFDAASEGSSAAVDSVKAALKEVQRRWRDRSLRDAGVDVDPKDQVITVTTDLTEGHSESQLPLYAPFILILAVMGGASMAALDAIAGERERGTIETLLVQPVPRTAIAMGKLGAVVAMAILSTIVNLVAMGVTAWLLPGGSLAGFTISAALLLTVLSVPLAVLLSAVLLAVTSYARSYREAQGYHYPIMLLAFLPASLPLMPGVKLDAVLAWVPVGNVALAISEILRDMGRPIFHLLALGTTSIYAALALAAAVRLLSSEEILSGSRTVEEAHRVTARKALSFALLDMLLVYYAGSLAQAYNLPAGLLITLWGIVLLPTLGFARLYGINVRETFALRLPSARAVAGALLVSTALAPPVLLAFRVQNLFLPAPDAIEKGFAPIFELAPWMRLFAVSISPGFCEEMLFRGLLLGVLMRAYGPWRAVIFSSLVFGTFHLSLHRFVPTTLAGLAMGLCAWRSGSIVSSMIVHAVYNGLLAFHFDAMEEASRIWWGVPVSLLILAYAWRLLGPAPTAGRTYRPAVR